MATPTDEEKSRDESGAAPPSDMRVDAEEEEDDGPDPVRLAILSGVLVVLISVWVWFLLHPTPKKFYADIPGVSLEALTPAQRETVLREANAMACDCGSSTCHYNVAECRHMERTECDTSMKLAAQIIKKVTGKEAVFTQPMPGGMPGSVSQPPTGVSSGAAQSPAAAPSGQVSK